MHVERTGSFRVNLPLERAFFFVSPEGERQYVKGWEPVYLYPPGVPSLAPGTVFETHHNNELTHWIVLAYSPAEGLAGYVRVTPGSRLGTVTVRAVERDGATDIQLTYRMTSISDAGAAALAALTEEAFAAMLREWETAIGRAVA